MSRSSYVLIGGRSYMKSAIRKLMKLEENIRKEVVFARVAGIETDDPIYDLRVKFLNGLLEDAGLEKE